MKLQKNSSKPLKVLHVGNIANNAYNNAKIQRQRGIEADVLCYDYYHIMSCPEWEDANFTGDFGDPFFPDWSKCELNGFKRPKWFVQGPLSPSLDYLLLKSENKILAYQKWDELNNARKFLCGEPYSRIRQVKQGLLAYYHKLRLLDNYYKLKPSYLFEKYFNVSNQIINNIVHTLSIFIEQAFKLLILLLQLTLEIVYKSYRFVRFKFPKFIKKIIFNEDEEELLSNTTIDCTIEQLIKKFNDSFPEQSVQLSRNDLLPWVNNLSKFKKLFSHYDVVQMYATFPIVPLLCGEEKFTAYEHGTIREIPFEDNAQGRVCAIGYKLAPIVFITNSDNLVAADRLGLSEEQIYCLPHAFDNEKLYKFKQNNEIKNSPSKDNVVFFSPSRQHWKDRDPSMAKGNDIIFHAVSKLKKEGYTFSIELVDWGRDVKDSKKLIAELNIDDYIVWIPSMKKRELWLKYLSVNAVIDQLVLPALGGVGFETMTLGKRLLTAMDLEQGKRFFGSAPVLYNVRDVESLTSAMREVLNDPEDTKGVGEMASQWIKEYHSADKVYQIQLEAYNKMLEGK